jgi:hypothetical protein
MFRYHPGEFIEANCTAERTKPPTNLTWYINQELVNSFYDVHKNYENC